MPINLASTAQNAIDVSMALIIIAGGLTIVSAEKIIRLFSTA